MQARFGELFSFECPAFKACSRFMATGRQAWPGNRRSLDDLQVAIHSILQSTLFILSPAGKRKK
jgi:hypothetical protein